MSKSLALVQTPTSSGPPTLVPEWPGLQTEACTHCLFIYLCLSPATYLELLMISLAFAALNVWWRLLSASLSTANTESSRFGIIL